MAASHSDSPDPDRRLEKAGLEQDIKESRRAVLVVNTRSRHGARAYSDAKGLLAEAGITLDAAYPVRDAERLPGIVREEIAKGRKFIIIGGGDGSISSVVDHFAYTSVVFGLLPLGTANSFARTLGVPLDLKGAIDVLVKGKVADVDLGKINEDYFANGSSIGMPAIVGRATPHGLKKWLGRGAYLLVAASEFMRYVAVPMHRHHQWSADVARGPRCSDCERRVSRRCPACSRSEARRRQDRRPHSQGPVEVGVGKEVGAHFARRALRPRRHCRPQSPGTDNRNRPQATRRRRRRGHCGDANTCLGSAQSTALDGAREIS